MLRVHLRQPGSIGDITDDRNQIQTGVRFAQLEMYEVEITLGLVQQDQPRRAKGGDLPGELGSDRSSRAGQENYPTPQIRGDGCQVEVDRRAAQQVFETNIAQLVCACRAVEQLMERRKRLELQPRRYALVDDPPHSSQLSRVQSDDGEFGPQSGTHGRQLIDSAHDADPTDGTTLSGAVQIDQANGVHRGDVGPARLT
jgi:hypothetical protein